MKKKYAVFFLVLCAAFPSLGISSICHQAQTVLSLDISSTFEQRILRNGQLYRLIRMDKSQQGTQAYQLAESYLTIDYIEILRRLGKDDAFIQEVQKTNQDLLQNSLNPLHVLLTADPKNPDNIIAGAAFVIAGKVGDLLLMEKELKASFVQAILRPKYPISEVARVGSKDEKVNPGTFRRLIDMIFEVMKSSQAINHFYVFTSKGHKALYKQFGYDSNLLANQETLPQLAPKDVIIEPLR